VSHDTVPDEVVDGKYQLLREVARGAQGVVYEARALHTGEHYALKRLRPEYSQNPRVARRFLQEARTIARFSHPNIVQVLDVGQNPHDGTLYVVQPLLDGVELRDALASSGRLRPREALDLLVPVMAALIAIHRVGVVHRDVKPANILLVRDEARGVRPVLLDFGIVKLLDGDPSQRTATGALLGTPLYMAPEQAMGDPTVDARADVWACGVILFEMIAGRTPVTDEGVAAILKRVVTEPAPRLDALVPGVSRALGDIVARALTIPREQRFASMSAFLEALLECPQLDANTTGRDLAARHGESLGAQVPLDAMETTRFAPVLEVASATTRRTVEPWAPDALVARVTGGAGAARGARAKAAAMVVAGVALGALLTALALRGAPPGELVVELQVEPAEATIELDGVPVARGAMRRTFARDGRPHTLRLSAPGHVARELTFRDEPPPPRQRLSPDGSR